MAKTIKQIADELGVSKTAVRKKIENLGLQSSLRKIGNQFSIEKDQETLIKRAFLKKETETKTETVSDPVFDLVSVLKEQLRKKDLEIERLHQLLSQEQELHARLQDKIALLELPDDKKESKKNFFARLFGRW